jgi:hypothetical protein
MRNFYKTWPFGTLSEGDPVKMSDGTVYAVRGRGWKKMRESDRHVARVAKRRIAQAGSKSESKRLGHQLQEADSVTLLKKVLDF